MNSLAYRTFVGEAPDPRLTVFGVYKDICLGLQNYPMAEETKELYKKEHSERHDWGWRNSIRFDEDDIQEIDAKNSTITIELGRSKPCGRGCCSDWISDRMEIPDMLISSFEAAEAWQYSEDGIPDPEATPNAHYRAARDSYVKSIVAEYDERIAAEKAEKQRKKKEAAEAKERRRIEKEMEDELRDQAEFKRLKAKYKEELND